MNYELAKKLIAENPKWIELYNADGSIVVADENRHPIGLEELIEACGDAFVSLEHRSDVWCAHAKGVNIGGAATPEEALANLWLALNEKKT